MRAGFCMTVPPEVAALARSWLTKASNDLKNADHTLTLPDHECPFDTACFHAQQCAEKALKAFLTVHGVAFQKIHDLGELLRLCTMAPDLTRELDEIELLIPYAVEARYPGEWDTIDRAEVGRAVALARKILDAIQRRLDKLLS